MQNFISFGEQLCGGLSDLPLALRLNSLIERRRCTMRVFLSGKTHVNWLGQPKEVEGGESQSLLNTIRAFSTKEQALKDAVLTLKTSLDELADLFRSPVDPVLFRRKAKELLEGGCTSYSIGEHPPVYLWVDSVDLTEPSEYLRNVMDTAWAEAGLGPLTEKALLQKEQENS
jgi:hypothetical protein